MSRTDKNKVCEAIGVYSTFNLAEKALKVFGATEEQVYQAIYGAFHRSEYNNTGYTYDAILLPIDEISTTANNKLNNF